MICSAASLHGRAWARRLAGSVLGLGQPARMTGSSRFQGQQGERAAAVSEPAVLHFSHGEK